MDQDESLKAVREDVFMRIGRNLLLAQQAEQVLKLFVAMGALGRASESGEESGIGGELERLKKQTLGMVVNTFYDRHCSGDVPAEVSAGEEVESSLSWDFQIGGSKIDTGEWKKDLSLLVERRNYLAHQLLEEVDMDCRDSCSQMIERLDEQYREISPIVRSLIEDFNGCRNDLLWLVRNRDYILKETVENPDGPSRTLRTESGGVEEIFTIDPGQ